MLTCLLSRLTVNSKVMGGVYFLFLKVTSVPCLIFLNTGLIISTSSNVIMVSSFLKLVTWLSLIFFVFFVANFVRRLFFFCLVMWEVVSVIGVVCRLYEIDTHQCWIGGWCVHCLSFLATKLWCRISNCKNFSFFLKLVRRMDVIFF